MRVKSIAVVLILLFAIPAFPQCAKCITGLDNQAYCRDPSVYTVAEGQLYAACTPLKFCYRMPGGGVSCTSICDGELCLIA